jgi:hypothetical protein
MAKIIEDVLVIKLSKIVKDSETDPQSPISDESVQALIQVAQELVGESVVVEIERA